MELVSRLHKVGVALGSGNYGTASGSFTRGLIVTEYAVDQAQTVEPKPDNRGALNIRRVSKGPLEYKATLNFHLDVGGPASAGIGDFLASLFGAETGSIPSPGKYLHSFGILQSALPPWLNLWSGKDAVRKQVTGFRASSLKFAVDGKEGQIPVDVEGLCKDESTLDVDQVLLFSDKEVLTPSMAQIASL